MAEGLTDLERYLRRIDSLALSTLPITELTAAAPEHHDGVMVALVPDDPEQLAVEGEDALPADDLHVTLCFLGKVQDLSNSDMSRILSKTRSVCDAVGSPFTTNTDGVVVMGKNDDGVPATALLIQSDEIVALYEALAEALDYESDYPTFIPHMTSGYGIPVEEVEPLLGEPVRFSKVIVKFGDAVHDIPLTSALVAAPRTANVLERVIDSLGRLWDEALHPRGGDGRFIKKNGAISGKLAVPSRDRKGVTMVDANRASVIGFHTFDNEVWVLAEITNKDGSTTQGFARATDVNAVAPVKARLDALYPIDDHGDAFINSSLERKRQLDLILAHIHTEFGSSNDTEGAQEFLDSLGLWEKDLDYLQAGDDDSYLGGLRKVDRQLDDDELDEQEDIINDARTVKELRDRVHGLRQEASPLKTKTAVLDSSDMGGPGGEWSPEQIARIQAAADALMSDYDVPLKAVKIDPDRLSAGKSNDTIYLPLRWADEEFMAAREREWERISINPTLEGTVIHEYGHILDGALQQREPEAYKRLNAFLEEIVPGGGGPGVDVPRIRAGLEAPSPYGTENRYEFVAEAFADWRKNGESAHPSSQFVGRLLDLLKRPEGSSFESDATNLEPHVVPKQRLLGEEADLEAVEALKDGADPFSVPTNNLLGAMAESGRFERITPEGKTGVSPIEWFVDPTDPMGANVKLAGVKQSTTNRAYFVKQSIIGAELGNTDIVNEVTASLMAEAVREAVGDDDSRLLKIPRSVFGDNPEWDGQNPPGSADPFDDSKTHQPGHVVSQHAAYLIPPGWEITDIAAEETSFRNDTRDLDEASQVDQKHAFYEDIGDVYGHDIAKMILWDFIVLNGDRNPGNAFLASSRDGTEATVLPIDHGFAFDEPFVKGDSAGSFDWFMNYQFTLAWRNYVQGGLRLDNNVTDDTLRQTVGGFIDAHSNLSVEAILSKFRAMPGVTDEQVERVEESLNGAVDRIAWMRNNIEAILRALTGESDALM